MVPDLLVVDIDSHGTILHLDAFDLTLAYPDWYDALCKRIRSDGPLEAGSIFVSKRSLSPKTIVAAVSTPHWVLKARAGDVNRALAFIGEIANAVDARNVSIAALGTRNGLRIGYVIAQIERHLTRSDRTIGIILNDEEEGLDGTSVDPNIILPSKTVTFIWDDMLCSAGRIRRRRLPGRTPWIITINDPQASKALEFLSDDLKVLRPVRDDERGQYVEADVKEFPYRASLEIGDRLVQTTSKGVMGPTLRLPWDDQSVTSFLHREAEDMAIRKSTGTARASHTPIDREAGVYVGELVWANEGFLLQRVDGIVHLHAIKDLSFCAHCAMRLGATAEISYVHGTASVRTKNVNAFDALPTDTPTIAISEHDGIDLRSKEFSSLRPSGFTTYSTEIALALMMSRPRRRLFARLVATLRRERRLLLKSNTSDSDDVDVRVIADVIASRYSKWLFSKRLQLAS